MATDGRSFNIGEGYWDRGSNLGHREGDSHRHPLDRATSALRWTVVGLALLVAAVGFRSKTLPDVVFLAADFALVLFLFLPDLSYYLVFGVRIVSGMIRRRKHF